MFLCMNGYCISIFVFFTKCLARSSSFCRKCWHVLARAELYVVRFGSSQIFLEAYLGSARARIFWLVTSLSCSPIWGKNFPLPGELYTLLDDDLVLFAKNAYSGLHITVLFRSRSFICDECGTVLKSAKNLRYHKTSYHKQGMQQDLVCDICGFATVQMNNLKRHIKAMHEKPEKCPYCENCYGTKDNLSNHIGKSNS